MRTLKLFLISCIVTSPLHAMETKEISLTQLQSLYQEDLTAIEQSDDLANAINTRCQKYRVPQTQGDETTLESVTPPIWGWLNIATAQGKEKLIEPLIRYIPQPTSAAGYPMDYALEQGNPSMITALCNHGMIHSRVLNPGGLLPCSKGNISDETMVYYVTKLNALKECSQENLASAAASIIDCCSDQTIRKCFFQGLLNPALSEGATPISLRMGMYIQEKLAIALEKTIDPEVKKQSWNAFPEKLALFREKASKEEFQDDEEAEQYYDLLHNLYFFMKARSEFSRYGDSKPPILPISESMADDIKEIIRTHKSLNASSHTFLCAAAILRYLFLSSVHKTGALDNDLKKGLFAVTDTFFPLCVSVLPCDKVESCLSVVYTVPKQKVKND